MPRNNNDAYALAFLGKFAEGYASAKSQDREYKEKLALAELDRKAKEIKDAADKKQLDFENSLKVSSALADADRAGRETVYVDDKGGRHTTTPLAPAQVTEMRNRIAEAARARGVAMPGLPPLPVPPAADAGIPEMLRKPQDPMPLPPIPQQATPLTPLGTPDVPPAKLAKYPSFGDDGVRISAEERRDRNNLIKDYESASKGFLEVTDAYTKAEAAYKSAQRAKALGQSSTAADKAMVFQMIRANQPGVVTERDWETSVNQGTYGEQAQNWLSMIATGRMTDAVRDQIFKLTRDVTVSKEELFKNSVEDEFYRRAKVLLPGVNPRILFRDIRPVGWKDVRSSYDADVSAASSATTGGGGWNQDQEAELRAIEAELSKRKKKDK